MHSAKAKKKIISGNRNNGEIARKKFTKGRKKKRIRTKKFKIFNSTVEGWAGCAGVARGAGRGGRRCAGRLAAGAGSAAPTREPRAHTAHTAAHRRTLPYTRRHGAVRLRPRRHARLLLRALPWVVYYFFTIVCRISKLSCSLLLETLIPIITT